MTVAECRAHGSPEAIPSSTCNATGNCSGKSLSSANMRSALVLGKAPDAPRLARSG